MAETTNARPLWEQLDEERRGRESRAEAREVERHAAEMRAYADERECREASDRREERKMVLIERDVVAHERRADAEERIVAVLESIDNELSEWVARGPHSMSDVLEGK